MSLEEDLGIEEEKAPEIDAKHREYNDMVFSWTQMDDTYQGTVAVKRKGTLYLPMPASFQDSSSSPSNSDTTNELFQNAPFYHTNPAYSAYLQRARFPDIFRNSVSGFIGIALKEDPVVKLPTSMEYLVDSATLNGLDLKHLYSEICKALMSSGRIILVADVDEEDNELKIVVYSAVDMPNWDTNKKGVPEFVVLKEIEMTGELNSDEVDVKFLLKMDSEEEGGAKAYTVCKYVDSEYQSKFQPTLLGRKSEKIPVTCINSTHVGFSTSQPPLQGVSDVSISMYQKDADLSHSEYMTCNPMLVGTGIDDDDKPTTIGSQVMYCAESEAAKLYFVEPKGVAHGHMISRIKELKNEAASYGAAFLADSAKAVESAETARINRGSKTSNLREVCIMAELGVKDILQKIADWKGETGEIVFEVEKDFAESKLSPQEQDSLLKSWMNQGITQETYVEALVDGNVLPKNLDVKAEIEKARNEGPNIDESFFSEKSSEEAVEE